MSEELRVLQAIRLKGRPADPAIAAATGLCDGVVRQTLRTLVEAGLCVGTGDRHHLTPAGRDHLSRRIVEERNDVDRADLAASYDRFVEHNAVLKRLVTDWQLIDGTMANAHDDPDYDARIVGRLADLHDASRATLAGIAAAAPRLAPYPHRLARALAKVRAGEGSWLAGPLIDSYHTVWFELHEDLLGLTGRVRADEAAAGRAG